MEMIRRTIYPVVRVVDASKGIAEYVASNEAVDSYREVIRASGWRFSRFAKNAPFVDSHDYNSIDRVLGKVIDFRVEKNNLVETVQWAIDVPDNKLAQLGWKMTEAGYLKAVSVGFIPLKWITKWDANSAQDRGTWLQQLQELGMSEADAPRCIYMEQEQIELSACVIGANPDAVARAFKAGLMDEETLERISNARKREAVSDTTGPEPVSVIRSRAREAWWSGFEKAINALKAGSFERNERNNMEGENNNTMTEEQFRAKVLGGVEAQAKQVKNLETELAAVKTANGTLETEIRELKKARLGAQLMRVSGPRVRGQVSDECARNIAAHFILHCERSGKMPALSESGSIRERLLDEARGVLNISVKTALTTSDIPLPTEYSGEIRDLTAEYGVVRRKMTPYPIGRGTSRPARMGTRLTFGSIAMSGAFDELSPTIGFASLESHKLGGIVRMPREIDEQSVVQMGQHLARLGAYEFSRMEDAWGFLADGTATYESIKGVCTVASENSKVVTLGSGKTKPSDATINDFRAMRRLANKAALNAQLSAYYLDLTWETCLREFNTQADPFIYVRLPDGSATLDGYPIVWTNVLQSYQTTAAAATYLAAFGALNFWWFGEHGSPRIDTSEHIYFANDQLATRFIEEIDFDYCAVDAMTVLKTAGT